MRFDENFFTPYKIECNTSYIDSLDSYISEYISQSNLILDFLLEKKLLLEESKSFYTKILNDNKFEIINIFKSFLTSKRKEAHDKFYYLINSNLKLLNPVFKNSELSSNRTKFYRVRIDSGIKNDRVLDEKHSLFHIPYNLRYLVSNGRFNPIGIPCLYVSSKPSIAIKETLSGYNYDSLNVNDNLNVAIFTNIKDVNILDFSLVNLNTLLERFLSYDDSDNKSILLTYISIYPIIISFHTRVNYGDHKNNVKFKYEYLIPSLFIDWFISYNENTNRENFSSNNYYLKYSSVHSLYPSSDFNYVFFSRELSNDSNYCPILERLFLNRYKYLFNDTFKEYDPKLLHYSSELDLLLLDDYILAFSDL
jgi:hypothetical protein